MLRWSLFFLVVAIIAGIFGLTGVSATATGIAKFLFLMFVALLVVSVLVGAVSGRIGHHRH